MGCSGNGCEDLVDFRRETEISGLAQEGNRLSSSVEAAVELESFFNGVDFFIRVSRSSFEELNMDLFRQLLDPVERVLRDSHVSKARVHDVFLTGGSSSIPKVRTIFSEFFEGKHLRRFDDESAATGAAIFAGEFSGRGGGATEDLLLLDVIPMALGVETSGGVFTEVVARNSTIPNKRIATFTVASDHPDCTEKFPQKQLCEQEIR